MKTTEITGQPKDIASNGGRPKPSCDDGKTKHLAFL